MTPRLATKFTLLLLFLFLCTLITACGGGGGSGDGFQPPAEVDIDATPKDVFIGGRTLVRAFIDDVHPDGVVLKFRFPKGLAYVTNTSRLRVAGGDVDVGPTNTGTNDTSSYVVFVFPREVFGEYSGELDFQLEARDGIGSAKIELQPSYRNLSVSDDRQFNINDPKFGTDVYVQIFVFPAE